MPLLAAFMLAINPTLAQADEDSDKWSVRLTIYGWLPDIDGNVRLPSGGGGPSINVNADQLLDNLDMTAMVAVHATRDGWGLYSDLIYLDEGASKSASRDFTLGPGGQLPVNLTLDAGYDLKSWVWTLAGTWRIADEKGYSVDLLGGARMLDIDQSLSWSFNGNIGGIGLPGSSGVSDASGTNWDAIIGMNGLWWPGGGDRWVVPWHVDVGTGDSDLTWQAMLGIGYRFDWGALVLDYRHLEYEFEARGLDSDLSFSGPLLGASFSF